VDFYCQKAGLIVEIDGKIHEFQQVKDREREHILIAKGLKIIRIENEEVNKNIEPVLDQILKACSS
jgi:very-short-patch-repair endonuclease